MELSEIKLADSISGALCTLYETSGKDGVVNHVDWRLAGTARVFSETWPGHDYDSAFKAFKEHLEEVVESIEHWDNE